MNVKSTFLNSFINEEVHISQPHVLKDHENPDFVSKLKWSIYDLKQAPRARYERLNNFLIMKGFNCGNVDTNLFIKHKETHI